MNGFADVGIAAVIVLLILREVFGYLRDKKNGVNGNPGNLAAILSSAQRIESALISTSSSVQRIESGLLLVCQKLDKTADRLEKVEDLSEKIWNIHNSYDAMGAPKWYTHADEWRAAIKGISETQMKIFDKLKELKS